MVGEHMYIIMYLHRIDNLQLSYLPLIHTCQSSDIPSDSYAFIVKPQSIPNLRTSDSELSSAPLAHRCTRIDTKDDNDFNLSLDTSPFKTYNILAH